MSLGMIWLPFSLYTIPGGSAHDPQVAVELQQGIYVAQQHAAPPP
jgi:hypothetical protein